MDIKRWKRLEGERTIVEIDHAVFPSVNVRSVAYMLK